MAEPALLDDFVVRLWLRLPLPTSREGGPYCACSRGADWVRIPAGPSGRGPHAQALPPEPELPRELAVRGPYVVT